MPDKIINVLPNITPVPTEGQEYYLIPTIRKEPDLAPEGGNFTLNDFYAPIKKNDQKVEDLDASLDETNENLRAIAIKKPVTGNPITIEDGIFWPIVSADFYGNTSGGQGTPTAPNPIDNFLLGYIINNRNSEANTINLPEPITLASHDRLSLRDSLANVIRGDKQILLTGDEPWEKDVVSANGRVIRYRMPVPDAYSKTGRESVVSNRFKYDPVSSVEGIAFIADGYLYLIPPQDLTELEAFKAWILANETHVQYQLKEPVTEFISSVNQAELAKLQTYDGTTTIRTDGGGLISIVYVVGTKEYIDKGLKEKIGQKELDEAQVLKIDKTAIMQNTGDSETNLMSQKAITDLVGSSGMPIDSIYVQFKGQKEPSAIWGGEWIPLDDEYAGQFFRAVGGDAAPFGSIQEEALPNIKANLGSALSDPADGAGYFGSVSHGLNKGSYFNTSYLKFDASRYSSIYQDNAHVTPYNSTIRIWKRTK